MKKLKIKFWQIENLVVMKILDQDERLRGKEVIYEDSDLDMTIYSVKVPDMTSKSLFIRGERKEKDSMVCNATFNSTEDATDYVKKCQKLISNYNASLEDEEEEVETIRTFIFE